MGQKNLAGCLSPDALTLSLPNLFASCVSDVHIGISPTQHVFFPKKHYVSCTLIVKNYYLLKFFNSSRIKSFTKLNHGGR